MKGIWAVYLEGNGVLLYYAEEVSLEEGRKRFENLRRTHEEAGWKEVDSSPLWDDADAAVGKLVDGLILERDGAQIVIVLLEVDAW